MKSIQADESRASNDVIEVKPPVMKEEVSCANSQVNLVFPTLKYPSYLGKILNCFTFDFTKLILINQSMCTKITIH